MLMLLHVVRLYLCPCHHPDHHQMGGVEEEDLGTLGQRASWGRVQSPGPVWLDTGPEPGPMWGKAALGSQPHSPNHQSGLVVSRKDPSTTSDPAPVVYLEMRRFPE